MVAKASKSKSAKATPQKAGRGRPAKSGIAKDENAKKLVKYAFKNEDNLQIYIYRLLKQVHPEVGISRASMAVVNKMILEVYKKLATNASEMSHSIKAKGLSAKDVQSAVKLTIPGELQKHCLTEVARAVATYDNSKAK